MMHKDTKKYWDTLRKELLYIIEHDLSPIAAAYHYSDAPLESKIKWKPLVLLLGNYSSGKSTLINEFIGTPIQETGQAPTDDCFTVITGPDTESPQDEVTERDGRSLLYDPTYPFTELKEHGESFAAHFRLKVVPSSALSNLAIIDTPGMLDSIAEKDRGYDYQAVIGDLAQIADLIIVFFDPHKAGTIKESYASLRYTLPEKTYEDRVIFVLNRIDECGTLTDLLKVYGTLCWNLSQMTGRKDIPQILLTYSPKKLDLVTEESAQHLKLLANQREQLQQVIRSAPKHRLDHLATFLEHHADLLTILLTAVSNYGKMRRNIVLKYSLMGVFSGALLALVVCTYLYFVEPNGRIPEFILIGIGAGIAASIYALSQLIIYKIVLRLFHYKSDATIEDLVPCHNQLEREHWAKVQPLARTLLHHPDQLPTLKRTYRYLEQLGAIHKQTVGEIRGAINQLSQSDPS